MKKTILLLMGVLMAVVAWAQGSSALDQLKADPRRAYGPFYISHYGRHGSRYYWNAMLYQELSKLLTMAHEKQILTPEGEAFYEKFMAAKDELTAGVSELSDLGWEQHQGIARTMYNNFPEVFKNGGNVLAISSLTGRCVLSMASFCQELTQCNPKIEIRESRTVCPQDPQWGSANGQSESAEAQVHEGEGPLGKEPRQVHFRRVVARQGRQARIHQY